MSLFANYLHPLIDWLQTNPNWALLITFIISLTESLVIIGSIIPGSVTMTAIGILAGSGIMRIDLTLLAATLGAIGGDSLSYALGYIYSDRLADIWPFKKYPRWLEYGKEFFAQHGGKSVLLGRFIGPLRSLIPVIAGIVHMKKWRFLFANILSAIGWSLLYVMPGFLIGTASHGLSPEMATHLFVLILLLLAGLWLLSIFLKSVYLKLKVYLKHQLHSLWSKLKDKPRFTRLYQLLTPLGSKEHSATAALVLSTLIALLLLLFLLSMTLKTQGLETINVPTHFFLRSFQTASLTTFFILCTQFTSPLTLISLYIFCCLWLLRHQQNKTLLYLSSLMGCSLVMGLLFSNLIHSPKIVNGQEWVQAFSFSPFSVLAGTSFYTFILLCVDKNGALFLIAFRAIILLLLGLSGLGWIYLGDLSFSEVLTSYCAGIFLALLHYLFYRTSSTSLSAKKSIYFLSFLLIPLFSALSLSTYLHFNRLFYDHIPLDQKYTLKEADWWNQQKPILPLYKLNRVGKKIAILNIQYVGDLERLKNSLKEKGWRLHHESFIKKLLLKMTRSKEVRFPLFNPLYEYKTPILIMTYQDQDFVLELNIWESNYFLPELQRVLYIGTLHQNMNNLKYQAKPKLINYLSYLTPALNQFKIRTIQLPKSSLSPTLVPAQALILLIKGS